jgi:hypothetical protein
MISTLFILGISSWPWLQHTLRRVWRRLTTTQPS